MEAIVQSFNFAGDKFIGIYLDYKLQVCYFLNVYLPLWCRFLYLPVSLGRTARYTLHAKFGRRMRPWWDEFCFSSSYDITRTFLFVLRVGKGKKRSQLNPRSLLSVGNSPRLEILESGGSVIYREVFKHPTYL